MRSSLSTWPLSRLAACLIAWALFLPPAEAQAQQEVEELLRELRGLLGGGGKVDAAALVAAELPAVQAVSGMTASKPITTVLVTRADAQAHVAALVAEQLPPERMAPMEYAWKAMGLLPADASLGAEIEELYAGQAGGFYDPKEARLVLLDDTPSMLQVPVVRHELVHALQDQTLGLVAWLGDAGQDEDRGAAVQAVLEGHATDVMNRLTLSSMGLEELMKDPDMAQALEGLFESDGATAPADTDLLGAMLPGDPPPFLMAQLLFPYLTGATFVAGYREAHPEDPGCRALYDRPPGSTAEVLDPSLWESGTFRPQHREPGMGVPGFDLIYHTALGRLLVWVLLTEQGDPSAGDPDGGRWGIPDRDRSVVVGSGWQGDRVAVYRRAGSKPGMIVPGSRAVVWVSSWDEPTEAARVAERLKQRLPKAVIDVRGSRVDVVFDAAGVPAGTWLEALRSWP